MTACEKRSVEEARDAWAGIEQGTVDPRMNRHGPFRRACGGGKLATAQWLLQDVCPAGLSADFSRDAHEALRMAAARGHLHVVQWLVDALGLDVREHQDAVFCAACAGATSTSVVADWLVAQYPAIDPGAQNGAAFVGACSAGNVALAAWIAGAAPGTHALAQEAFQAACGRGRLEAAQWLVQTMPGAIDVHAGEDASFLDACALGHLEVARWLVTAGHGAPAPAVVARAFLQVVVEGYRDLVQWMVDTRHDLGLDIHAGGDAAFRDACECRRQAIAKIIFDAEPHWGQYPCDGLCGQYAATFSDGH